MVGNNKELKQLLLKEFHSSTIGGHSGMKATRERISNFFHWKGLQSYVYRFVQEYDVCQQNKGENTLPLGLLKSLSISKRV